MKFKEVKVLINSEGDILTVVQRTDDSEKQLYLVGLVLQCRCKIMCKTNVDLLEMFVQGKISVSELFRSRSDEPYILEFNHHQEKIIFDEVFEKCIFSSVECGNKHFFQISQNMRLEDPMELLRILKSDFINSFGSVPVTENQLSGQSFITRHPEFFE